MNVSRKASAKANSFVLEFISAGGEKDKSQALIFCIMQLIHMKTNISY